MCAHWRITLYTTNKFDVATFLIITSRKSAQPQLLAVNFRTDFILVHIQAYALTGPELSYTQLRNAHVTLILRT